MSVLKVHGNPASVTASVLLTLYEKEADFELVWVNLEKGEHLTPFALSKHPFGRIPWIEDGDLTLFESRAITRYLSEKYADQGADLYPEDLTRRAFVNQWIDVEAGHFGPPIMVIGRQRFNKFAGKECNEELVTENLTKLEKVLDIYEDHLAKSKYIAGDSYSLADVHHMPGVNYLLMAASAEATELVKSRQHFQAWWEDVTSRPSWKKYKALLAPMFAR